MILFALRCSTGHEFEGWFRNGAAFEEQSAAHLISCPECGDKRVTKAPMAPRLQRSNSADRPVSLQQLAETLRELRRHVEENCDYVGERFAEEARRIHYGEIDPHDIYGETTAEEAESLSEEGIEFDTIPWLPRSDA
jgi:hypothetical protein